MRLIEIRTENPQIAFNRVNRELVEVSDIALGPNSSKKDINKYNNLHAQVRRVHKDGSIGHLHLKREILIFDGRIVLDAPVKKVPFRLKSTI